MPQSLFDICIGAGQHLKLPVDLQQEVVMARRGMTISQYTRCGMLPHSLSSETQEASDRRPWPSSPKVYYSNGKSPKDEYLEARRNIRDFFLTPTK